VRAGAARWLGGPELSFGLSLPRWSDVHGEHHRTKMPSSSVKVCGPRPTNANSGLKSSFVCRAGRRSAGIQGRNGVGRVGFVSVVLHVHTRQTAIRDPILQA
jgi:hypothetical protein